MNDDAQLLSQYARTASEDAFGEMVARHLSLVYSAVLRMVNGDTQMAQDITQTVFTDLARKAGRLSNHVVLAGWLYQAARYAAAKAIRAEHRRALREQRAVAMQELNHEPYPAWEQLSPLLEEAMGRLGSKDRNALLLHYFEGKEVGEVAIVLGLSSAAARKRLSRALDKLRRHFSRRGLTLSSEVLAGVLAGNVMAAMPPGFASIVAASSLAGLSTTTLTALTMMKTMLMTKIKAGLVGTIVLAATVTTLVEHFSLRQLRGENQSLREQVSTLNQGEPLAKSELSAEELERLRQQEPELLRLRGEVGRLRPEAAKVAALQSELAKLRSANGEETAPGENKLVIFNPYLKREAWSDKGTDTPYHALETMLWASFHGDTQRLSEVTIPGDNSFLLQDRPPLMKRKGVQIVSVDGFGGGWTRIGAIVEDEFYGGGLDKPPGTVQGLRYWYLVQTDGEWRVTGRTTLPAPSERASGN